MRQLEWSSSEQTTLCAASELPQHWWSLAWLQSTQPLCCSMDRLADLHSSCVFFWLADLSLPLSHSPCGRRFAASPRLVCSRPMRARTGRTAAWACSLACARRPQRSSEPRASAWRRIQPRSCATLCLRRRRRPSGGSARVGRASGARVVGVFSRSPAWEAGRRPRGSASGGWRTSSSRSGPSTFRRTCTRRGRRSSRRALDARNLPAADRAHRRLRGAQAPRGGPRAAADGARAAGAVGRAHRPRLHRPFRICDLDAMHRLGLVTGGTREERDAAWVEGRWVDDAV